MVSKNLMSQIYESECECINLCVPKEISNVIVNDYEGVWKTFVRHLHIKPARNVT